MLGLLSSCCAMLGKVTSVYFSFYRIRQCKFMLGHIMLVYNMLNQVM
jgi:hypothetical protein